MMRTRGANEASMVEGVLSGSVVVVNVWWLRWEEVDEGKRARCEGEGCASPPSLAAPAVRKAQRQYRSDATPLCAFVLRLQLSANEVSGHGTVRYERASEQWPGAAHSVAASRRGRHLFTTAKGNQVNRFQRRDLSREARARARARALAVAQSNEAFGKSKKGAKEKSVCVCVWSRLGIAGAVCWHTRPGLSSSALFSQIVPPHRDRRRERSYYIRRDASRSRRHRRRSARGLISDRGHDALHRRRRLRYNRAGC